MFEITIYAVRPDGTVDPVWSAPDAHPRLVFHIWDRLSDAYGFRRCYGTEMFRPLWRGIHRLSKADRWVLSMTFGGVVVGRDNLPTLLAALEAFQQRHPHQRVSHLITALGLVHRHEDADGVCFALDNNQHAWMGYNIHATRAGHWVLTPNLIVLLDREVIRAE
jgi:hypothetical protein